MFKLLTSAATKIKREPVGDSSILDACDVIALPTNSLIVVQHLRLHTISNHWKFELAQPINGIYRPGTWYAYMQHVSPAHDSDPVPTAQPENIEFNSGRLTAKQLTFLKRTPDRQAGELVNCDKLQLAAGQTIQVKQIVGIVPGNEGRHWCFELDGELGGKHREGVWYAWENDVAFLRLDYPGAGDGSEAENLIRT